MSIVQALSEITKPKVSKHGGKGYSLAVLLKNRFNVPQGFLITSSAFFKHLVYNSLKGEIEKSVSEITEANLHDTCTKIKNSILAVEVPPQISDVLEKSLRQLNVQHVSIRSSAASEDTSKASFAGLHDTFLNIRSDARVVSENVKKCWASLFNERAVLYRIRKGIPHSDGMAVIVQEMIPARISGITFTMHPADRRRILIEVSYGIGDIIVGGRVEPDDYTLDRETLEIVEKKIGKKNKMSIADNEGIKTIDVEKGLAEKQVLPDNKVIEIAGTSLEIERLFSCPQDIEWCIRKDTFWLLQSRPIAKVHR